MQAHVGTMRDSPISKHHDQFRWPLEHQALSNSHSGKVLLASPTISFSVPPLIDSMFHIKHRNGRQSRMILPNTMRYQENALQYRAACRDHLNLQPHVFVSQSNSSSSAQIIAIDAKYPPALISPFYWFQPCMTASASPRVIA